MKESTQEKSIIFCIFVGKHISDLFINSKPLGWISKAKPSLRLGFNTKLSIAYAPYSMYALLGAFKFSIAHAHYSAHALLRPKLQSKSKRELGGGGMTMCVCEREKEIERK